MAKPKILIVDDESDIAETLSYMLQAKGFSPVIASDGADGLKKLSKESPDLVLLDVKMPIMDGYEVCSTIRKTNETKSIPIIMVTSESSTDSVIKAHKVGANDYLVKPYNLPTLLQKMRRLI